MRGRKSDSGRVFDCREASSDLPSIAACGALEQSTHLSIPAEALIPGRSATAD